MLVGADPASTALAGRSRGDAFDAPDHRLRRRSGLVGFDVEGTIFGVMRTR